MKRDVRVAILTMEGTNNEEEAYQSFRHSDSSPEIVHLKKFENRTRRLDSYDVLFFPGGFSAGDYVRAGAVMAARIRAKIKRDLENFVEDGRPVMGSCNGFQVLVELGLIPDTGQRYAVEAALAPNASNRFEARTVYLNVRRGNCLFLDGFSDGEIIKLPIAHSEGRFVPRDSDVLRRIVKEGLNVLTYVSGSGKEEGYPWNPNGSEHNIAGICNRRGNVLGVMPHPERIFSRFTETDWTRERRGYDIGNRFFESAVRFIREKY